jgi:hypothetical protein
MGILRAQQARGYPPPRRLSATPRSAAPPRRAALHTPSPTGMAPATRLAAHDTTRAAERTCSGTPPQTQHRVCVGVRPERFIAQVRSRGVVHPRTPAARPSASPHDIHGPRRASITLLADRAGARTACAPRINDMLTHALPALPRQRRSSTERPPLAAPQSDELWLKCPRWSDAKSAPEARYTSESSVPRQNHYSMSHSPRGAPPRRHLSL